MNAETITKSKTVPGLQNRSIVFTLIAVGLPSLIWIGTTMWILGQQWKEIESTFDRGVSVVIEDIAGADLRGQSMNIAQQLDEFLIERIQEGKTWAVSDRVVKAARMAAGLHEEQGLKELSIEEIENRFRVTKSLEEFPGVTKYLRQQIDASAYFAEVFFTDRNGFNVAMTNPTSDFVQSDEEWWQGAWSHSISIGEIEYDDSAGVWSVDISIRIDDPEDKKPLGVIKTVLSIDPVQRIAERTAESIPGGRVQIATGGGELIAETSSGHARERIMNPEINVRTEGNKSVREAFSSERSGVTRDEDWITAYTRTGGRQAYAESASRFAGFDWIVILQRPVSKIREQLLELYEIESTIEDSYQMIEIGLAVGFVIVLVTSIGFGTGSAGRIAKSLERIREMAERSLRGEHTTVTEVVGVREFTELNESIEKLSRGFVIMRRNRQGQGG